MKTFITKPLWLPVSVTVFLWVLAGHASAQAFRTTFRTLYSFTAGSGPSYNITNNDGAQPQAGLVVSANILYGTTGTGGSSADGTVFALNTDGTHFTTLHSFAALGDGATPIAALILVGDTLYGTTVYGGNVGNGTVFKLNTNGSGFTSIYSFNDGGSQGSLIFLNNLLYGTTAYGGPAGNGTVFALSPDGASFTPLYNFTTTIPPGATGTNNEGAIPYAGMVLSDNILYGTTAFGGSSAGGTIFAITTDGSLLDTPHSFSGYDGDSPQAGLISSGDILYGTTAYGGIWGHGTVFKVNTSGTDFTTLHSFTGGSDGAYPAANLVLSGNTLYGTTRFSNGTTGKGTVFRVDVDGADFSTIYAFTAVQNGTNGDGAIPFGGLVLAGNALYGTTARGGSGGNGTVFSISLPVDLPKLTITQVAANVILSWPTNATGFVLQSTTNLASSALWSPVPATPVIVNGQNTVTNPISGSQQLYRLINNSAGGQ